VTLRATLLAVSLLAVAGCPQPRQAPPQPLSFDHSVHAKVQLQDRPLRCVDCHNGAETGTHAGLPSLSSCLRCHMRPQGDPPSDSERKVRSLAAEGGSFRWVQITRNPGHVYFSHGAHVSLAGMECADCHGDVTAWRSPPTEPNQDLKSMSKCMSCHRERGAPNECGTCHQ
jgi:menaquinone reductase, multiheme cytochrome c subunit